MFADRQGSILWVTQPSDGTVVAAYEYDGYGAVTQTQGTLAQPYGYTGREFDVESGLYHYRARRYDQSTGQFIQTDPVGFEGETFNTYEYVRNDPFNALDPSGRVPARVYVQNTNAATATGIRVTTPVFDGVAGLAGQISTMLTQQLGHPAPIAEGMMTCPADLWNALEALKPLSEGLSCKGGPGSAPENIQKMRKLRIAITVRRLIQTTCFPWGDAGHEQQIKKLYSRMDTCLNLVVFGSKKKPKSN